MAGEPKYTHEQIELILRGWVYKQSFAETAERYAERFGENISAERVRYVKNKYCKDPRYGTPLWNYRDRAHEYDEWLKANPHPRRVPEAARPSAAPPAPPAIPPPAPVVTGSKPRRSRARARASRAKKVEPLASTAIPDIPAVSGVSAAPGPSAALPAVSSVAPAGLDMPYDVAFSGFQAPSGTSIADQNGNGFDFGSFGYDNFGFDTGLGMDDPFLTFDQQPLPDLSQPAFPEQPSDFDLFNPQFGADWDTDMGLDDIFETGPGLESSPTLYKRVGMKGEQEEQNSLLDPRLFDQWLEQEEVSEK